MNRLRNAALFAASLLVALLLAELGLRVARFSYPAFCSPDQNTGAALRPFAYGWHHKEGHTWIEINSRGQRDREHEFAKPPGTFRIAVLGDSYAEALNVPMEKAFWSVLERSLDRTPAVGGKRVEVLNFGVSGFGTAQELMALRSRAWRYDPDMVVLAFLTGNDVRNNSRVLEGDPRRPYFTLDASGRLLFDNAFRSCIPGGTPEQRLAAERHSFWLADRVRLIQLQRSVYDWWVARRAAQRAVGTSSEAKPRRGMAPGVAKTPEGSEAGLDMAVYAPPRTPAWEEAWRVTEALVAQMGREVRERRAPFLVVTLTNGIQVHPDPAVRARFAASSGIDDLEYPDKRIEAFCRRQGIPCLVLVRPFREEAERRKAYFHGWGKELGGGHWNEAGHRLGGELIAREAVSLLADSGPAR